MSSYNECITNLCTVAYGKTTETHTDTHTHTSQPTGKTNTHTEMGTAQSLWLHRWAPEWGWPGWRQMTHTHKDKLTHTLSTCCAGQCPCSTSATFVNESFCAVILSLAVLVMATYDLWPLTLFCCCYIIVLKHSFWDVHNPFYHE